MLRKICAVLFMGGLMASCGSQKPHIQTSKNSKPKKPKTSHVDKTETASGKPKKDDKQVEVLESTSKTVVYSELVKEYINTYKEIAKDNMRRHGIPASITLSQGILESGAGQGTLCTKANNHFGIKCHTDWTGEKVYHDDDSAQECFRKYPKASESFNDHSLFLTTRGRYAALFKLDKDDYEGWAKGLRAAGYATDPKYPEKLIGLIERYDLAQYDAEVLSKKYEPKVKNQPAVVTAPKPAPVKTTAPTVASQAGKTETAVGTNEYRVVQGDTMYSISKKHNLTVDQLMQLNGLTSNALSIGQVLKIK